MISYIIHRKNDYKCLYFYESFKLIFTRFYVDTINFFFFRLERMFGNLYTRFIISCTFSQKDIYAYIYLFFNVSSTNFEHNIVEKTEFRYFPIDYANKTFLSPYKTIRNNPRRENTGIHFIVCFIIANSTRFSILVYRNDFTERFTPNRFSVKMYRRVRIPLSAYHLNVPPGHRSSTTARSDTCPFFYRVNY